MPFLNIKIFVLSINTRNKYTISLYLARRSNIDCKIFVLTCERPSDLSHDFNMTSDRVNVATEMPLYQFTLHSSTVIQEFTHHK